MAKLPPIGLRGRRSQAASTQTKCRRAVDATARSAHLVLSGALSVFAGSPGGGRGAGGGGAGSFMSAPNVIRKLGRFGAGVPS